MGEILPIIYRNLLLFIYVFMFISTRIGVLSVSILTIENKCDHTVWPVIYSWTSTSRVNSTGFTLKKGEAHDIRAPFAWYGLISGRTLCSTDKSTRNFTCATGDCESGKVECPGDDYSWSSTTYASFRLDKDGFDRYVVTVEHGYNLPIMVVPSMKSVTCVTTGCVVDLNKTCPKDLMELSGEKLVACSSPCLEYGTPESCCLNEYSSKENCKATTYTKNFENACPLAYIYAYTDNYSTLTCPNTTDYVITFCPTSFTTNNTIRSNNTTSMASLAGEKHNSHRKLRTILGVSTALVVLVVIIIAIAVTVRRASTKSDRNEDNIEAVVMLKRYSYESVKKMTKSFSHVLGKGGSGTVYKGKLPDASGRDIALKILKESNGDGEEFINELASMSRASHVNIVSLFGFCNEGNNRAIIYEFMPNGSLDKFISKTMSTKMDWRVLYNIALGVAHGLEYLHNSCVSKIVHFDIKPQNILMDQDLCPKISDFGLAKLCKNKESNISLLNARGTIGYIAPEVFSKNFGGVSHKSDVYSYGMVVLEMIGAKNMTNFVGNSSCDNVSMYFPDWIYEDLKRKETMSLSGDHIMEEEDKIAKTMTLVGLWCIQTKPSDRPPMRKVVEMLEGSLEDLQVPPKPLLKLPFATPWESVADSQGTSSFSTLSQLERTTL